MSRPITARSLHINKSATLLLAVAAIAATDTGIAQTVSQQANEKRIAIWGSSVANGTGDESQQGGYAGHLQELLAERGWELTNQSKGGDNTVTIAARFEPGATPEENTKYLTSVDPAYVVIGLSLGNEGIAQCQLGQENGCTNSFAEANAVFDQFASGLQRLIPCGWNHPDHRASVRSKRLLGTRIWPDAPHEPADQLLGRAKCQHAWRRR